MSTNLEIQPEAPKPSAPRPRRSVFRALISEVRRFYYRVTKENIAGFLWTLAWTIPITVFIWVYAESELEQKDQDQQVRVQVQSRDPSKIVTLLEPKEGIITCTLEGPRSNLDRLEQSMRNLDEPPITIALDTRQFSDQRNISTLENLLDNPRFRDAGVTISDAKPEFMLVSVDTISKIQLPVRVPATMQVTNASFDPPTVTVTGPSKVVSRLTQVNADLSSIADLQTPGKKSATVSLTTEQGVTCEPREVKVTLMVAEQDETWSLPNVPVWVDAPQDIGYSITTSPQFVQIKVVGPPEEMDALKKSTGQVHAALTVGFDNVRNPTPQPVKIEGLPPDVRLVDAPPTVGFTASPQSH
jgi:hypothetical protein